MPSLWIAPPPAPPPPHTVQLRPACSVRAGPRPIATETVTITVSVSLPAGTCDVEAALIADELRTCPAPGLRPRRPHHGLGQPPALRRTGSHDLSLPPPRPGRRRGQPAAPAPQRDCPRTAGAPSQEAPRRQLRQLPAVSPAAPRWPWRTRWSSTCSRWVRIDGQDVDFTHKELELLAKLACDSRRTISRTEPTEPGSG